MKIIQLIRSSLLTLVVATAAGLARADVIVDTGSNPAGTDWTLGTNAPLGQWLGAKFTVGEDTTITSVEGFNYASSDNWLDISIAADGGSIPGTNLYTTSAFISAASGLDWHGVFGLNWALSSGSYWVTFVGQSGFVGGMPGDAPNAQAIEAFTATSDGVWYNYDGLNLGVRINGEPTGNNVPDSGATLALIGAALAGLAAIRRRLA